MGLGKTMEMVSLILANPGEVAIDKAEDILSVEDGYTLLKTNATLGNSIIRFCLFFWNCANCL